MQLFILRSCEDLERLEVEAPTQQQLLASLRLKSVSAFNDPGSTGRGFEKRETKTRQTFFFPGCAYLLELVVHFRLRLDLSMGTVSEHNGNGTQS